MGEIVTSCLQAKNSHEMWAMLHSNYLNGLLVSAQLGNSVDRLESEGKSVEWEKRPARPQGGCRTNHYFLASRPVLGAAIQGSISVEGSTIFCQEWRLVQRPSGTTFIEALRLGWMCRRRRAAAGYSICEKSENHRKARRIGGQDGWRREGRVKDTDEGTDTKKIQVPSKALLNALKDLSRIL